MRSRSRTPDLMQVPPVLPPPCRGNPVYRTALLVNPFYAKDPNASFGKHVLTPTLALTSIAGATPPEWKVSYWDENLLQGPPPTDPLPQVVGITVHLTFAQRAYELAAWFKAQGCIVILGGLHALSCPEEVAVHGDAIAIGNGVPLWPRILRDIETGNLTTRYRADYQNYAADPPPDRSILPRWGFLTGTSLLLRRGVTTGATFVIWRPATRASSTRCAHPIRSRQNFRGLARPTRSSSTTIWGQVGVTSERFAKGLRPWPRFGAPPLPLMSRTSRIWCAKWRSRDAQAFSSASRALATKTYWQLASAVRRPLTMPEESPFSSGMAFK